MERINVDQPLTAQLEQLHAGVQICDNNGRVLGYFTPASDPDRTYITFPIPVEELKRRARESTGRPLKDIMADLEKLTDNES